MPAPQTVRPGGRRGEAQLGGGRPGVALGPALLPCRPPRPAGPPAARQEPAAPRLAVTHGSFSSHESCQAHHVASMVPKQRRPMCCRGGFQTERRRNKTSGRRNCFRSARSDVESHRPRPGPGSRSPAPALACLPRARAEAEAGGPSPAEALASGTESIGAVSTGETGAGGVLRDREPRLSPSLPLGCL